MKVAFRISWSRAAEKMHAVLLSRVARLPRQPLAWSKLAGPYYGNEIATLPARRPVGHAGDREGRPRPRRHRPAHPRGRPPAGLTRSTAHP